MYTSRHSTTIHTCTNLGSFCVQENGDGGALQLSSLADAPNSDTMALVIAVGKVQTSHVHAGTDQTADVVNSAAAGGPERAHDFGFTQGCGVAEGMRVSTDNAREATGEAAVSLSRRDVGRFSIHCVCAVCERKVTGKRKGKERGDSEDRQA